MGEEIGEGGDGVGLEPDGAEDRGGVEAEGADGGKAGRVDAAEGDDLGEALGRRAGFQSERNRGVGKRDGRAVAKFGEGRENWGEEDAGAVTEGGKEGGEIVAGVAGEGVAITGRMPVPRRIMGGTPMPRGIAEVEATDGEVGGEVVVGVEDEARVKLGGNGSEVEGEARAVPGGLAQVVVREAGLEETWEGGEFAGVFGLWGDEEEFHRDAWANEWPQRGAERAKRRRLVKVSRPEWLG